MVIQSVIGPIGLPAAEALYPTVVTAEGQPMSTQHDYVIPMSKEELPPAKAFWSITLYDLQNGFFIPNEQKKYSVGENAGMKLDQEGGIVIYIAAEESEGAPEENWLPINRQDEDLARSCACTPDMEKMKTWQAPKGKKYNNTRAS